MERPMQKLNDLSRSPNPLDPDGTLIAVIELSLSSWLVAGILVVVLEVEANGPAVIGVHGHRFKRPISLTRSACRAGCGPLGATHQSLCIRGRAARRTRSPTSRSAPIPQAWRTRRDLDQWCTPST